MNKHNLNTKHCDNFPQNNNILKNVKSTVLIQVESNDFKLI